MGAADVMAHGNVSDLVAVGLFAIAAHFVWAPQLLFTDGPGPLKAWLSKPGSDVDILIKFMSGLFLTLGGMMFSVKWNPANGKMTGLGLFVASLSTAYATFAGDANVFVPRIVYGYCFVLLLGGIHVFFMPSNPTVKQVMGKDAKVPNNHGNISDKAFFCLFIGSMLMFFYPDHLYMSAAPHWQGLTRTADTDKLVKLTAGLLFTVGMALSGVKWNPINGKMGGFFLLVCVAYTSYSKYKADNEKLVGNIFYVYAVVLFFAGVHILAFPSNELPKAKTK